MGRPATTPRTPFGQRLHAARQAAGLSQTEVANGLGIKQAAYAAWERRRVALYPDQIQKLAHVLKIPVKDLFERTPRSFMKCGPTGRARRAFEALSKLPRREQANILDFVEAMLVSRTHRRKDRFAASEHNAFLYGDEAANTRKPPKAT